MKYKLFELKNNYQFLDLGSFYSKYAGQFFYYRQRKVVNSKEGADDNRLEYIFHLCKSDCKEVDKNGTALPTLMCHLSDKGSPLPIEILRAMRQNKNKIYISSTGYADFILSTIPPDVGLTSKDKKLGINLFNIPGMKKANNNEISSINKHFTL